MFCKIKAGARIFRGSEYSVTPGGQTCIVHHIRSLIRLLLRVQLYWSKSKNETLLVMSLSLQCK